MAVLGAALAASSAGRATAAPAALKTDLARIKDGANKLAAMLQARHGERYRVTVDDEAGFVLITQPIVRKGGAA